MIQPHLGGFGSPLHFLRYTLSPYPPKLIFERPKSLWGFEELLGSPAIPPTLLWGFIDTSPLCPVKAGQDPPFHAQWGRRVQLHPAPSTSLTSIPYGNIPRTWRWILLQL